MSFAGKKLFVEFLIISKVDEKSKKNIDNKKK